MSLSNDDAAANSCDRPAGKVIDPAVDQGGAVSRLAGGSPGRGRRRARPSRGRPAPRSSRSASAAPAPSLPRPDERSSQLKSNQASPLRSKKSSRSSGRALNQDRAPSGAGPMDNSTRQANRLSMSRSARKADDRFAGLVRRAAGSRRSRAAAPRRAGFREIALPPASGAGIGLDPLAEPGSGPLSKDHTLMTQSRSSGANSSDADADTSARPTLTASLRPR